MYPPVATVRSEDRSWRGERVPSAFDHDTPGNRYGELEKVEDIHFQKVHSQAFFFHNTLYMAKTETLPQHVHTYTTSGGNTRSLDCLLLVRSFPAH
jgi:hypothetical protein